MKKSHSAHPGLDCGRKTAGRSAAIPVRVRVRELPAADGIIERERERGALMDCLRGIRIRTEMLRDPRGKSLILARGG